MLFYSWFFQGNRGYLYKKNEGSGIPMRGAPTRARGSLWANLLPPHLFLDAYSLFHFQFSDFSSFLILFLSYFLEFFKSLEFFKHDIYGKFWMSSFHKFRHHVILSYGCWDITLGSEVTQCRNLCGTFHEKLIPPNPKGILIIIERSLSCSHLLWLDSYYLYCKNAQKQLFYLKNNEIIILIRIFMFSWYFIHFNSNFGPLIIFLKRII